MTIGFGPASSARVQLAHAARENLLPAEVAALAQSRHRAVRELVAARTDVPLGVLAALANDTCHQVRAAVAANSRAARAVIEHLGADHHVEVARGLVRNDAAPREVLAVLASHRRADVREAAVSRLAAAPLTHTPVDPDARFPELRDRVAHAPAPAPLPAQAAHRAEMPVTYANSLSLLAQRISLTAPVVAQGPVPASAARGGQAPEPAPAADARAEWSYPAALQRLAVAAAS